ncbi:long-chain fatty acid--CoA ligase [Saccharophagus sp. K07]|uniref:AMP-binding protein n=1 Tax=Saccharophagus sp. K07 TaxID=2283636 RepID=UPI001651C9D7|nr:AMP-binding protein [Saccharophagus sp. K07]MBC6907448.1 long-chain fatty acid--CoA ligase [Saccharophagus sp. K07]
MESKRYATVNELLQDAFTQHKHLPAFTCFGHTFSYAEIDALSARFASYLQNHSGLKPGDRIAIQLPNIHQYPIALYGAIRAGLVVVNTNPLYTTRELLHQLKDSGAKALIVLANVANRAAEILPQTQVETVIVTEVGDMLPPLKRTLINFFLKYVKKQVPSVHFPRSISFREALARADQPWRPVDIKSEDLVVLQYTGGTTGLAKGAMLTHGNLCANVHQVLNHMTKLFKTESQVVAVALPLYHIFAFNIHGLCALIGGAHSVLIPNPRDIPAFVKAIKPYKISLFVAVNTLYNALLHSEEFRQLDFSELKTSAAGGMALMEDVARKWLELTGCEICEGYGLTETSPVLITNPDNAIKAGTIGTPVVGTEVKIIDEKGNEVSDGQPGELCARGPQIMPGYWQKPEATAEVLSADGWFKTGDIAIRRPDGYYKIVDRKKDMIVVSGFNVYPNEVEDVVTQHPDIIEAAVIGVPSKDTGEAVKLFVVTGKRKVPESEIIAFCRERLTGYKIPKVIEYRDSLPKSNVGKILRRELRDESTTHH